MEIGNLITQEVPSLISVSIQKFSVCICNLFGASGRETVIIRANIQSAPGPPGTGFEETCEDGASDHKVKSGPLLVNAMVFAFNSALCLTQTYKWSGLRWVQT